MWDTWLQEAKPVMPVIVINDLADAVPLAQALVAGGVKLLEITLRTECALEAIAEIKANVPGAIVGVGTVISPEQLTNALIKGAEFAVSPGFTPRLLEVAKEWGGPYLPGISTPSEVMQVREAGFREMKFFPAVASGGRDMLRSIGAPIPDVRFCPTGGIGAETYRDFLELKNVFTVGGSWLTPEKLITARKWQEITDIANAT